METQAPVAAGAPNSPLTRDATLPTQYYYVRQLIGTHKNKPIFLKKVLAVYPKGLKIVHATTSTRTVKELSTTPLLKFVDIREFQFIPDKSIFRFHYRSTPSNDPMPLATDLQYEFELALVVELQQSIELAIQRLVARRKKAQRSRTSPSPTNNLKSSSSSVNRAKSPSPPVSDPPSSSSPQPSSS